MLLAPGLTPLRAAGGCLFWPQVLTAKDFAKFYTRDAEWNAMLDYELALRALRFVGNSASSFSALAILERRHQGRWAAHYNGGAMPIEAHIPAPLLPWVFAYHSATPHEDYMVKVRGGRGWRGGGGLDSGRGRLG